jgi:hypothetical protein
MLLPLTFHVTFRAPSKRLRARFIGYQPERASHDRIMRDGALVLG